MTPSSAASRSSRRRRRFCQTLSHFANPLDLCDQHFLLDMNFLGTPQLRAGVNVSFFFKVSFLKHPNGHPPSARQRRHPRQPGACPALGAHRRNYLKCNTFMKPLECTLFALSHVDDQFVHYSLKYTPHTK